MLAVSIERDEAVLARKGGFIGSVTSLRLVMDGSELIMRGYVLVNHAGADGHSTEPTIVDKYSATDGAYLSSALLPGHYTQIVPGRNTAYTVGPAGVDVWAEPQATGLSGPGEFR